MRRWGPWEQAASSSQPKDGLAVWEGACLEGDPLECRVRAFSEAAHQGLPRLGGVCLEEEEGGGPATLGGGGEACLCGEMLPY